MKKKNSKKQVKKINPNSLDCTFSVVKPKTKKELTEVEKINLDTFRFGAP